MKTLMTLLVSVCAISLGAAKDKGLEVPKGAFTEVTYADGRAKAVAEKKYLVYILTDLKTTCPKCFAATEAAIKEFKSDKRGVLVVAQYGPDRMAPKNEGVPFDAARAKVGNVIPQVMILNAEDGKLLACAGADEFEKDARIWKKLWKEAAAGGGGVPK